MSLGRRLAGDDGPGRDALPVGELLRPVPLAAVLVLVVNDHCLKGAGALPGWLTGILSDLAGVLFFPLLLTSLADLAVLALARATGRPLDYSLRPWKLAAALAATAIALCLVELSPAAAQLYTATLGRLGLPSATTGDPYDLLALVMLVPAAWLGRAELARVPLGRLAVVARRCRPGDRAAIAAALADVRRLADPQAVDELSDALAAAQPGDPAGAAAVTAALARLRG